ncbi:OFA family MFS transporter [bacterium]
MNRWWVVVGGILIQLSLGAIYAWSVFTPALENIGWTKLQTQIVFSVGLATFAIVMVWAGKKLQTWGPRRLAVLGGIILGSGYALAGILGGTHFWLLVILIGFVGGAGIGMAYVVPIAVSIRWFPDKKGLITGLAVAGFGFGAMGWIKLAGSWGNLIDKIGLSWIFILYGIAFAILVLVGSLWMLFPPKNWKPVRYENTNTSKQMSSFSGKSFTSSEMLRTKQFFTIFLTFVFSAGAGLMSIGIMKLYPMEALQQSGYDTAAASAVAGSAMAIFFSIANGLGRIIWGSLSDVLGRKRSIVIMSTLQGIMVFSFIFMARQPIFLYIGATIIGFNFGGNISLFPTITADTFGTSNVGENYPYVFLAYGVGGLFGPILGGLLGDMGNFPLAFGICGLLCLTGAVLTSRIKPLHN